VAYVVGVSVQLQSEAVLGHGARRSGRGRRRIGGGVAGRRVDEELGLGSGRWESGAWGLGSAEQLCFVHFCGPGPSPLFIPSGPLKASMRSLASGLHLSWAEDGVVGEWAKCRGPGRGDRKWPKVSWALNKQVW